MCILYNNKNVADLSTLAFWCNIINPNLSYCIQAISTLYICIEILEHVHLNSSDINAQAKDTILTMVSPRIRIICDHNIQNCSIAHLMSLHFYKGKKRLRFLLLVTIPLTAFILTVECVNSLVKIYTV